MMTPRPFPNGRGRGIHTVPTLYRLSQK